MATPWSACAGAAAVACSADPVATRAARSRAGRRRVLWCLVMSCGGRVDYLQVHGLSVAGAADARGVDAGGIDQGAAAGQGGVCLVGGRQGEPRLAGGG